MNPCEIPTIRYTEEKYEWLSQVGNKLKISTLIIYGFCIKTKQTNILSYFSMLLMLI